MPYRRLPNTDTARLKALKMVLDNNEIYTVRSRFIDWKTLNQAQSAYDKLFTACQQYKICVQAQIRNSSTIDKLQHKALMYVSHFLQVLFLSVERGEIRKQNLSLYGLPTDSTLLPKVKNAESLIEWGMKVVEGEKARLKKGGRPIYNPTIGMVSTHYDIFKDTYERQKSLQTRTLMAANDVKSLRPNADAVLLSLWNQIESYYEKESRDVMVDECRKLGVVYYTRKTKNVRMKSFIDTHSHLDGDEFKDDLPEVIARAKAAGVAGVFLPSINLNSINSVLNVYNKYPDFTFPMIGLHPEEVNINYKEVLTEMHKRLEVEHPFIAIGEVGLDYYWSREFEKEQLEVFEEQVKWSVEFKLPLMIHCRKAQNEMVKILRKYEKDLPGGVFHCFTGNEKEAAELLSFDRFVLGIGGVLTFKNSHLPEVLHAVVPLDRLVIETDSPYMTPVPHRGERNESAYAGFILEKIAEIYGVKPCKIARSTNINVMRVFGISLKEI